MTKSGAQESQVSFAADRRANQGAGRLAGRDARPAARPDQGSRSRTCEETWKWRGVPVWEHAGILCTGETYKDKVKLTFAKGASLNDPSGLFNASLDGNARRAIDFQAGDEIDEKAFKALIRAAVALNEFAAVRRPKKRNAPAPGR